MENFEQIKEIFDLIVIPEAENILKEYPGLFLIDNSFEVFRIEYEALYDYCFKKFMHPKHGFDSHKQIALYITALLKAKIIKTFSSDYYELGIQKCAFNETLAFNVGCDYLGTVIENDYLYNKGLEDAEKIFSAKCIRENGLFFPKTSYSNYCRNVVTEFFYTTREGSYNFLGLADKLFWIEQYNKSLIKKKYLEQSI